MMVRNILQTRYDTCTSCCLLPGMSCYIGAESKSVSGSVMGYNNAITGILTSSLELLDDSAISLGLDAQASVLLVENEVNNQKDVIFSLVAGNETGKAKKHYNGLINSRKIKIEDMKINVFGAMLMTMVAAGQAASGDEVLIIGGQFLQRFYSFFASFIDVGDTEIINQINAATDVWLDNQAAAGITIRDLLLSYFT